MMLDLGAVKRFNRLTVGAALRNLGPGMTFHDESAGLPVTASLGATYYLPTLPLVPAAAVELPLDDLPVVSLGAEYTAWSLLALRAGLRTDRDAGWPSWLRFGLGVATRGVAVDYAVIPGQEIGATHMISLSYRR
ncbi:MAG: hypothetical protein MUF78_02050 [Candidatus Edwardsbacteria bacterium]|nr:hypothetical protein [Candidatus Edwardsbacteria bacterium]